MEGEKLTDSSGPENLCEADPSPSTAVGLQVIRESSPAKKSTRSSTTTQISTASNVNSLSMVVSSMHCSNNLLVFFNVKCTYLRCILFISSIVFQTTEVDCESDDSDVPLAKLQRFSDPLKQLELSEDIVVPLKKVSVVKLLALIEAAVTSCFQIVSFLLYCCA